ncbi:MAG: AraC family transcriptional regulator [Oliverpabstia sp.]|nr:AraC family transcriptional regulator [Oliverpabstia sp.]
MSDTMHEKVITTDSLPARSFSYSSADQLITNHWHNSLEVLYITSGKMDTGINNAIYHLKRGDLIIINSGDIHFTRCRDYAKIYVLQVPYPLLNTHIPNYDYVRFQDSDGSVVFSNPAKVDELSRLMIQMYEITLEQKPGYTLLFSSKLYQFLFILFQRYHTDISSRTKQKSDRNLIRLEQVMNYVKSHYTQPISLEDAAQILSLNPEYFCRYFKKYMGMTFLEYVNSIRLYHIHQDLLNTNYSVSELMDRHGFTNYKLFSKMFRNTYGCPPGMFRRQQKQ